MTPLPPEFPPETDMLSLAIGLAAKYHAGQVDKLGEPYILHPIRVMMRIWDDPKARIIAILHDTLEDTELKAGELLEFTFDEEIINAILSLTRLPNEGYQSFIQVVAKDPLATKVKIADIQDNLDPTRLSRLDPKTAKRLVNKYEEALEILFDAQT